MASEGQPLQNKGIFRNLPTYSQDIKGLRAIVTGANGISGFHTMRVLLESPERWAKVYAVRDTYQRIEPVSSTSKAKKVLEVLL